MPNSQYLLGFQGRAFTFGQYGARVNANLAAGRTPAQAFRSAGRAPNGYNVVRNAMCWEAVYQTAYQSNYISAAEYGQLQGLRAENLLRAHFHDSAAAYLAARVQENFGRVRLGIFWFVRRTSPGVLEPFRQAAHAMIAFGGSLAAGSNNAIVVSPNNWPLLFAEHDVAAEIRWDEEYECWVNYEHVPFDIVWTPASILGDA